MNMSSALQNQEIEVTTTSAAAAAASTTSIVANAAGGAGGGGDSGNTSAAGGVKIKVQSNESGIVESTTSTTSTNLPDKVPSKDSQSSADALLSKVNYGTEEVPIRYESDAATAAAGKNGSGGQRSTSPGSTGSVGSVGTNGSGGTGSNKAKRRSWKKPKDKPKRPLSSYNIFFKHERTRIVEGKTGEATPEETIRSIEYILSSSRETRRHRKTHGRITFGDLARRIADKWKAIPPEEKALFDHYASIDMRRYRKEVQLWKERKECESTGGGKGLEGSNPSYSDSVSEYSEAGMNGSAHSHHSRPRQHDPWAPRQNLYDSMSNSFSSVDSEFSMDPLPIRMMRQQQQIAQRQQQQQQQISQANFHQSMPNVGANFYHNNGMPIPGGNVHNSNNSMMFGMQQQGPHGGDGTFGYEQDLSPMDLNANVNDETMASMLQHHQQQQQMMLQNQFEMGFQQQNQQQRMNNMHNSFSGRPSRRMHTNSSRNDGYFPDSVPMFVGSNNTNNQDMNASSSFQQNNARMEMQAPENPNGGFSFHSVTAGPENGLDPVPFNEVFPDDTNNPDLENYLSNLDLSNM
eukprot:CAMPEP_0113493724 /NCGR_PEP_ID=MMETSP0014_2-20120614/28739_1 /TAXON_ID=2857 /ORGANISM="Nitzschia sp." /LENGTH=574 /DNA_ID=CAMNT_0000387595 /DNA_START=73 /DNA_END=1797 /DNA_ORIENTATION=- /assembly_acc=CAM_ASM_000159